MDPEQRPETKEQKEIESRKRREYTHLDGPRGFIPHCVELICIIQCLLRHGHIEDGNVHLQVSTE
jgi:hypothetical protein